MDSKKGLQRKHFFFLLVIIISVLAVYHVLKTILSPLIESVVDDASETIAQSNLPSGQTTVQTDQTADDSATEPTAQDTSESTTVQQQTTEQPTTAVEQVMETTEQADETTEQAEETAEQVDEIVEQATEAAEQLTETKGGTDASDQMSALRVGNNLTAVLAQLKADGTTYRIVTNYVLEPQSGVTAINEVGDKVVLFQESLLDQTRIMWLQEQLKIAGYYTLIDGIYSDDTMRQMAAFCIDQMAAETIGTFNSEIEQALITFNKTRLAGDIDDYLVYASKTINLRSSDVPSRLVDLSVNHIIAEGVEKIEDKTNQQLVAMFDAAQKDGITLRVVSAYRSFEYQIRLFNRRVVKYGFENANYSTAIPGQSEHQTGLVVDLDDGTWTHTVRQSFDQTTAYQWLDAHAHEYGFILSYPKDMEEITGYMYEPWHYRFVGSAEVATEIKQRAITLEQYVKAKLDNQ